MSDQASFRLSGIRRRPRIAVHGLLAVLALAFCLGAVYAPARAAEPVALKYTRAELEAKWRTRIAGFLDRGVIPLIDLESYLPRPQGEAVLGWTRAVMDELGVALMSLAGFKAPKDGRRGYRWSYYTQEVVNADPDRFIPTTNKGGNRNWWRRKGGKPRHFIDQVERHVRSGQYLFIGEIEFRHYMSNRQCREELTHRDLDIPLYGRNGHRVFRLAAETGAAFSIHLEPEDAPLRALEAMVAKYPKANVIIAHFGQIRHPERETRFTPALVERLLKAYPNLYYDISTGEPGRRYRCTGETDTVLWQDQTDILKPAYKRILTNFSGHFVVGFDYGPANRNFERFLRARIANVRLILKDLPDRARHDIAYRNAWKLLTGRVWRAPGKR